jgi:uncharacterized repeat protein (TIGR01451 family)
MNPDNTPTLPIDPINNNGDPIDNTTPTPVKFTIIDLALDKSIQAYNVTALSPSGYPTNNLVQTGTTITTAEIGDIIEYVLEIKNQGLSAVPSSVTVRDILPP